MVKRIMSFFAISSETADSIFGWSNFILILGAAIILVGTIGAIWSAGVRERYADLRLSKNEKETATAKENAEKASENAAIANMRTEEIRKENILIQLELERERIERIKLGQSIIPRKLTGEQIDSLTSTLRMSPPSVRFTIIRDHEANAYGKSIISAFAKVGSKIVIDEIGVPLPQYGITLTIETENITTKTILAAFDAAKIPIQLKNGKIDSAFDAIIEVWLRPPGILK